MISLSKDSGFTLMEMLVVIAVMALVLLLVTGYGPPRSHRLQAQAVAQQIAQIMRSARGRAIAQGEPVRFMPPPVPGWLVLSMQPPGGIVFAPDGSASGGRVRLDGAGLDYAITADWLTGQVHIDAN